jgi:hypothetical protein
LALKGRENSAKSQLQHLRTTDTDLGRKEKQRFAVFVLHSFNVGVVHHGDVFLLLARRMRVEGRTDGFGDVSKGDLGDAGLGHCGDNEVELSLREHARLGEHELEDWVAGDI